MNTIGSLILLVSIAMIVTVGSIALSDSISQVQNLNDSKISTQASGVENAVAPILSIFGFFAMIVGTMIVINSFR